MEVTSGATERGTGAQHSAMLTSLPLSFLTHNHPSINPLNNGPIENQLSSSLMTVPPPSISLPYISHHHQQHHHHSMATNEQTRSHFTSQTLSTPDPVLSTYQSTTQIFQSALPLSQNQTSLAPSHQPQQQSQQQNDSLNGSLGDDDGDDGGSGGAGMEHGDAEGVWSADIEQAFQEALAIYPPCGRRKIILSEEGKMYGRNELIARYIKLRTGKTRTRKQVSSHIQVLARRRTKEGGVGDNGPSYASSHSQNFQSTLNSSAMNASSSIRSNLVSMARSSAVHAPQMIHHHAMLPQSGIVPFGPSVPLPTSLNSLSVSDPTPSEMSSLPLSLSATKTEPSIGPLTESNGVLTQRQLGKVVDQEAYHWSVLLANNNLSMASLASLSKQPQVCLMSSAKLQLLQLAAYISHTSHPLSDYTCFHLPPEEYETPSSKHDWHMLVRVNMATTPISSSSSMATLNSQQAAALKGAVSTPTSLSSNLDGQTLALSLLLEPLDITQIADEFPERNGLKELFEKGPSNAFFLLKIWGDVSVQLTERDYFGTSIIMQSMENIPVRLNTKICSFGRQVVEKIEDSVASLESERYFYRFNKTEMCDYMKSFIAKLIQLPSRAMMNSVLENFTILQVATHSVTQETLLCLAYVFEVSQSECGSQHKFYRLVCDNSYPT